MAKARKKTARKAAPKRSTKKSRSAARTRAKSRTRSKTRPKPRKASKPKARRAKTAKEGLIAGAMHLVTDTIHDAAELRRRLAGRETFED